MAISTIDQSLVTSNPPLSSLLTTRQATALCGVHANTIYSYVQKDKLRAYRIGDNGNLRFSEDELRQLFGIPRRKEDNSGRKVAILARVSSQSQKSMLATQKANLKKWVAKNLGDKKPLIFENIVSSFGDRKELYSLIFRIIDRQDISHVVYSYRDRLSRVACLTNLIRNIAKRYNVQLVQVEQNEQNDLLDESYQELVEFITVLSCRANGRKSRRTNMVEISEECFKRMYILKKSGYSERYICEILAKEGFVNPKTKKPYERATIARRMRAVWTMLEKKYGNKKTKTSFHRFAHKHLSIGHIKPGTKRRTIVSRKLIVKTYLQYCEDNKELPVVAGTITKLLDAMGVEKEVLPDRSVQYTNLSLIRRKRRQK